MQKAKVYAIQGSNLELFGSDVEHNCKESAAQSEEQWQGTGKAPGLKIWRIEKFKVVPWPEEHYGEFFEGDSYIVFHTSGNPPNYNFDVHFWLGAETTQDEAGTAAYKTVELDDFHKGAPVQHREVQGHESPLFLSYFPQSIRLLKGGVETGFRHVKPEEYQPRLFHVRGSSYKDTRVWQVPLTRDSLNSGDCFVLDAGLTVYHWNGAKSAGMERMKAGQFAQQLVQERNGRPHVVLVEDGNSTETEFWALLGGHGPVKTKEEGDKEATGPATHRSPKVLRLSDSTGTLSFDQVASRLDKSVLDTNDVFVLDSGDHVWVWVGKGSSSNEKRHALGYAHRYLVLNNLPLETPISRVPEGAEGKAFHELFH